MNQAGLLHGAQTLCRAPLRRGISRVMEETVGRGLAERAVSGYCESRLIQQAFS